MQPPKLRRHKGGQYFVRWGGRDRYLGREKRKAEAAYWESLAQWRQWREHRQTQRAALSGGPTLRVAALVKEFLRAKMLERGESCERDYRKYLRRFAHWHGDYFVDQIRPRHLNLFKLDLIKLRYAPRTINHDLTAVRVMYRWAAKIELAPPIDLGAAGNLPVGPANPRTVSHEEACAAIRDAHTRVRPWLALNYLGLLRPSEVGKVIRVEGEWSEHGVFILDRGKMDRVASMRRHCVLSDEALDWLRAARPHWRTHHSYTAFVRKSGCPIQPKVFQRSAAEALVRVHGCAPDDVELLLGHTVPRIRATYYRQAWPRLRGLAGLLRLSR